MMCGDWPACLSIEESDPPDPGCVNNLSCMIRLCLSSSSLRSVWASAARSAGRTAIILSSISANTDWRSEDGSVAKKLAGSTGASGLAVVLVWAANLSCSILCWAKTCTQKEWAWKLNSFVAFFYICKYLHIVNNINIDMPILLISSIIW